jgi:Archaebacterial flagellin
MNSRLPFLLHLLLRAIRHLNTSQHGQIGTEIAIVGVVCASCVLGGVLITTSDEAAAQFEGVFHAGLAQASGTLILNGSVIATASGSPPSVDEIVLKLGTIGEPSPVSLDSTAESNRLVISFQSAESFDNDVPYTASEIVGDGDGFLEAGETAELHIDVTQIDGGLLSIGALDDWTLQLSSPAGRLLEVSRTMPYTLDPVNSLH